MRDYGKVHTQVWSSNTFRDMSEDGRALALYLLTTPHGNISGVFRLPDGYACEDLQWTAERVRNAFNETLAKGFANRCETSKWVWVIKHLQWNPPENPNQRKAAQKMAAQVPADCAWNLEFMRVCGGFIGIESTPEAEPLANPSATLPQPVTVAVTVTVDKTTGDKSPDLPPGFTNFWETWPTNDRKQAKGKCLDAWKKASAEREAGLVLAHVGSLKNGVWMKDGGQFIPSPLVYLNQRRWEGAASTSTAGGILAGAI